jgi:hypothetical protein
MSRFSLLLHVPLVLVFGLLHFSQAKSSDKSGATERAEWKAQIAKSRQRVEDIRRTGAFSEPQPQGPDVSDISDETRDDWLAKVAVSKERVSNLIQRMEAGEQIFADIEGAVDDYPTGSVQRSIQANR